MLPPRRLLILLACAVLQLPIVGVAADAGQQPREAAIATAHPLATRAGIEMLKAGGNAFDAAVAVSAALAVVEPYSSGLGGGGFYLLHRANSGRQVMLDARETAPILIRQSDYLNAAGELDRDVSLNSIHAAGIPGLPAALERLAREYGRLPLKQTLGPAIRYAREGFLVGQIYRRLAEFRLPALRRNPAAAAIFLDEGQAPKAGFKLEQPALADTLEAIAEQGSDVFYRGEISKRLIKAVTGAGGKWASKDLATYEVKERRPIVSYYHDIKIISAPPPSSGGIVLGQALNILAHFELDRMDLLTRTHVVIEAMRLAYRDRAAYLGDSDFVKVPTERLLNLDYAAGLANTIDLEHASDSESMPPFGAETSAGMNTTHFSIIDTEGNRVSATLSINLPFGNGIVAGDTGILLNNELDDFALEPMEPNAYGLVGGEANAIRPGKRPLSSMSPTFLETKDKVAILGTPGGGRIISMVLLGVLEFAQGSRPAHWVAQPRYHHQFLPDVIQHEPNAMPPMLMDGLRRLGHRFQDTGREYGDMQAILWHKSTNTVFAASDPRGEGTTAKFAK